MALFQIENAARQTMNVQVLFPSNPAGTIVLHHGYGGSIKSPAVKLLGESFLQQGLITVLPETTNCLNSSGGHIEEFTFSGHASDLGNTLEWATAQDWYKGPLHIAGYSLGGYSALTVAAKRDDVESLLLVAPIFSGAFFKEAFETANPGIMDHWKKAGQVRFQNDQGMGFSAPYSCWAEWEKANSLVGAQNITAKISMVTASEDTLILPKHMAAAQKAFDKARFDHHTIADETHFFTNHPEKLQEWAIKHFV